MTPNDLIQDGQALLDARELSAPSRRTALKAAIGVGYAAAALPIMAQTAIKTSADGLTVGEVMIDVKNLRARLQRADQGVLVLVHGNIEYGDLVTSGRFDLGQQVDVAFNTGDQC